jgi:putative hydroxymethylpyrimidine transport system substrate-binding protein
MTRLLLPLLALTLLVAGCGEKSGTASAGSGKTEPFTLMLDYFPNADHAGIYAAKASGEYERAGLDVKIVAPPDAALPLKLLEAGRADVAISYQPEVLLARDQGADIVSVGALVQKPLTSLMSLGDHAITDPKQLAGKRVGTSGIPYQSAYLKTILDKAGVDPGSVKETNVGFKLTQAMLSKKVDATLGAFWNYEGVDLQRRGKKPHSLAMEDVGVPTYNELVFAARRKDLDEAGGSRLRRFLQATARGTRLVEQSPQKGGDQGDAAGVLPRGQGPALRLAGPDAVERVRDVDALAGPAQAARAGGASAADERVPAGRRPGPGDQRAGMSPRAAACMRCTPASPFHSP